MPFKSRVVWFVSPTELPPLLFVIPHRIALGTPRSTDHTLPCSLAHDRRRKPFWEIVQTYTPPPPCAGRRDLSSLRRTRPYFHNRRRLVARLARYERKLERGFPVRFANSAHETGWKYPRNGSFAESNLRISKRVIFSSPCCLLAAKTRGRTTEGRANRIEFVCCGLNA